MLGAAIINIIIVYQLKKGNKTCLVKKKEISAITVK